MTTTGIRDCKLLPLTKIRLDGNCQPREGLDDHVVREYQEVYERYGSNAMRPAEVLFDGASYWLWDGFHRHAATDRAGLKELLCNICDGTQADAQWLSCSANSRHGLRRSTADKAKAVKRALRHPKGAPLSDSQIADHVGVSDKTVAKYRAELESTSEIPKLKATTGKDGKVRRRPPRDVADHVAEDHDDHQDHDAAVVSEMPKSHGKGIERAHEAINVIRLISPRDPLRDRGLQIVADFIKTNAKISATRKPKPDLLGMRPAIQEAIVAEKERLGQLNPEGDAQQLAEILGTADRLSDALLSLTTIPSQSLAAEGLGRTPEETLKAALKPDASEVFRLALVAFCRSKLGSTDGLTTILVSAVLESVAADAMTW